MILYVVVFYVPAVVMRSEKIANNMQKWLDSERSSSVSLL